MYVNGAVGFTDSIRNITILSGVYPGSSSEVFLKQLEEDCQNNAEIFKNVWKINICIVTSRAASLSPVPPPSTAGTLPRPGTKQVTVTVQETVVEPAQQPLPPPPAPVVTTTRQHHASSATKELDDLMASLSDFKVCVTCVINLHKSSLPPPLKIEIKVKVSFTWISQFKYN